MDERRVVRRPVAGESAPRLKVQPKRAEEWSDAKRRRFLDELALTANVTASAAAAKMGVVAAYRLRRRDEAFRAAWGEALSEGYERLEMMMLERAMNGVTVEVREKGAVVGHRVEYSDAQAMKLLMLHRQSVAETRAQTKQGRDPDVLLAELRLRLGRIGAGRSPDDDGDDGAAQA